MPADAREVAPRREKIDGVIYVPQGHVHTYRSETGWLLCAAFLLLLGALLNIAWGSVGLTDNFYFGDSLTHSHPETWGWLWIIFGVGELIIATMVLARNLIGLVLAGVLAAINAALRIPGLSGAHSGWAVAAILADVLVIYAVLMPWRRPAGD